MGAYSIHGLHVSLNDACICNRRKLHLDVWTRFRAWRNQKEVRRIQVYCRSSIDNQHDQLCVLYCTRGIRWPSNRLLGIRARPLEHSWFLDHHFNHNFPVLFHYLLLLRKRNSLSSNATNCWGFLGLFHVDKSFLLDETIPSLCLLRKTDSIDNHWCQRVQCYGIHYYPFIRCFL